MLRHVTYYIQIYVATCYSSKCRMRVSKHYSIRPEMSYEFLAKEVFLSKIQKPEILI